MFKGPIPNKFDNDTWETPPEIVRWAESMAGAKFDFDAACTTKNCVAPDGAYHDKGLNGLEMDWGLKTWCNPPYSDIEPWVLKATQQARDRGVVTHMLIPCDTSTDLFHLTFNMAEKIYLFRGRIAFINPMTGRRFKGNRHASMLVVFAGDCLTRSGSLVFLRYQPDPNFGVQKELFV